MLRIDDAAIGRGLAFDNPWWRSGNVDQRYLNMRRRREYLASLKQLSSSAAPRRSVVLLGPRRVGKSVLLQHLINDLIQDGVPPQSIVYVQLDAPLYSGCSLERLLDVAHASRNNTDDLPIQYAIFDEVQYLSDWERHLKVLTDSRRSIQFVVSGSATAALKRKSTESGAGRFTELVLPPLSFAEYLHLTDQEQSLIDVINDTPHNIDRFNSAFLDYINFGGYPESALSPEIRANPDRFIGRDIADKVLLRDLPTLYGIQDIQELNRLFMALAFNTAMEVSLENLSQQASVSKGTLQRYMEYLEAAFLIIRTDRVDSGAKKFERQRNFKVYLTNPSMRAGLFGPVDENSPELGHLVENAVFTQVLHGSDLKSIHYARWKGGEIDLVAVTPATQKPLWAIEVKWGDSQTKIEEARKNIQEFSTKNPSVSSIILTTRTHTDIIDVGQKKLLLLPTALLCYSLGRGSVQQAQEKLLASRHP